MFTTFFAQICKYCLYVTCHKKKFTDLLVGEKEKETWPELRYCFKVRNVTFRFIILKLDVIFYSTATTACCC